MAYVDSAPLEEEENATGAPALPGGGAPMSAAPATAAPGAQQQKTPGKFADLGEYLRVNAPQEFGGQLAGKIGGDIEKGQQTLSNAQGQFKERADANTISDTQGLINQVGSAPEGIDAAEYAKLRDASYKGPTNLSETPDLYNQVQGSAGSAVNKANASQTEGGRFALLDNYFGRPSYNQGQKSLDNLLVQNDQKSKQAFDQMRQNAQGLQQGVNQAGVELGSYGTQAKATTEATRKASRDALGIDDAGNLVQGQGAIGSLYGGLQSRADEQRALAKANSESIAAGLTAKDLANISPELVAALGLDKFKSPLWNIDPSRYYQGSDLSAFKPESVANESEIAKWNALKGLSGAQLAELSSGGGDLDGDFNFGSFDTAVKDAERGFEAGIMNKNITPSVKEYIPSGDQNQHPVARAIGVAMGSMGFDGNPGGQAWDNESLGGQRQTMQRALEYFQSNRNSFEPGVADQQIKALQNGMADVDKRISSLKQKAGGMTGFGGAVSQPSATFVPSSSIRK
jgi:hypothetical protein